MKPTHSIIPFAASCRAWPSTGFNEIVKREIEQLDRASLPLQQGITRGSYVTDEKFSAMILGAADDQDFLRVKAGIFYRSIIAGCNCSDDPTPTDSIAEYCVVQLMINKDTFETAITLITD